MRVEFAGTVELGDECRLERLGLNGAIHIGGVDIVDAIAEEKFGKYVNVYLNGEYIANGEVVTATGWGYSEYTPMDEDRLLVGDCDLIDRLNDLEGEDVRLVIESYETPVVHFSDMSAMVAVYGAEVEPVWVDYTSRHKSQGALEKHLRKMVRDGAIVGWRLIHKIKEVKSNEGVEE